MAIHNSTVAIYLWEQLVGAITWDDSRRLGIFEYDPGFLKQGVDVSPLHMPISQQPSRPYVFSGLSWETYRGLPGLLADALPDRFGNLLIDVWLERQGRDSASFTPVERLCYIGARGMGALEFKPTLYRGAEKSVPVEINTLVQLAQEVTDARTDFNAELGQSDKENREALQDILRVGTSAGGARPKAVIAMNREGKVRSGQVQAPKDYDYWLLKFDGVTDIELGKPQEFGRIEYAYSLMARAAGISMSECRLLEENGRAHFLTKRFDRVNGKKLHLQSLCGLAHYDFNVAGAYGYEQAFKVMRQLRLPKSEALEQYKRMVFNVLARNQDDHTKNIAFLMDEKGHWRLSPAYDVTYAHNPQGQWTNQHQMTIAGKRDHFSRQDLIELGKGISLNNAHEIIDELVAAIADWPIFAKKSGVSAEKTQQIGKSHRRL